jgi:hypothetical protein
MAVLAVHLADRGAALKQGCVDGLLVGQRQAFSGRWHQGRAAAGDQAQHQIVFAQVAHHPCDAPGRHQPRFIGHRVHRFHDFDALAWHGVAIACDHQAF